MLFSNRLKGQITQALVRTLLQDGGYRIVPLGVEEVIREVATMSASAYAQLRLPPVLRSMPDFFVSAAEMERHWLVEVKYRKKWDEATRTSLGDQISPQVETWGPLNLIVFLGSAGKENETIPSSWFGIVRLTMTTHGLFAVHPDDSPHLPWDQVTWKSFYRIQDFFPNLKAKSQYEQQTLQQVRTLLPQLASLQVFE